MTVAVVDIGTNTALLLVASVEDTGWITPLVSEQRIPRLGRGVDASATLLADSMDRAIGVLQEYRDLLQHYQPESVVVCGTSALRDASNREEFAARVMAATGYALEILSGEEEALWTFAGALSGLRGQFSGTVVDIGGGSTEVSWGEAGRLSGHASIDVGAVRLSERFLRHDPPAPEEIEQARVWLRAELNDHLRPAREISPLIGVAGTATTLALLDQGLQTFSIDAIVNYRLSRRSVDQLLNRLCTLSHEEIRRLADALHGREDIIVAGTLILQEVMELLGASELVVSERGIRYGLVRREWARLEGRELGLRAP